MLSGTVFSGHARAAVVLWRRFGCAGKSVYEELVYVRPNEAAYS
jgi:hypothetical protein